MAGKLYIVPTPVGNLGDMTPRAVEVLKAADIVLAEDTRTSGVLLKHFDIATPMRSHRWEWGGAVISTTSSMSTRPSMPWCDS